MEAEDYTYRGKPLWQARFRERREEQEKTKAPQIDVVNALVDVLWNANYRRADVEEISRKYYLGLRLGNAAMIEEAFDQLAEMRHQKNIEDFGEETVMGWSDPGPYKNLGAHVLGVGAFRDYGYEIDMDDLALIAEWREEILRQADDFSRVIRGLDARHPYRNIIRRVLGENPDEADVARFSLAVFMIKHKAPWHSILTPARAFMMRIFGGKRKVRDFGKRFDFCADVMLVAQILADEIGFEAEVHSKVPSLQHLIRKGCHHYLVYKDDGVIFDPDVAPRLAGYIKGPEQYQEEAENLGDDLKLC